MITTEIGITGGEAGVEVGIGMDETGTVAEREIITTVAGAEA